MAFWEEFGQKIKLFNPGYFQNNISDVGEGVLPLHKEVKEVMAHQSEIAPLIEEAWSQRFPRKRREYKYELEEESFGSQVKKSKENKFCCNVV